MYRGIRLRIPDLPDQLNIDRYFSLRMFKSGIVFIILNRYNCLTAYA